MEPARLKHKYFYQFRIILIGDSTVGKSSLLRQFTEGQFFENSDPTVGVDFHVRVIELKGNKTNFLAFWGGLRDDYYILFDHPYI